MSGEARTIAIARHYAELVAACRKRVAELDITHAELDHLAGLQDGYASKLLCEPPMKRMGPLTMFLVFEALGMQVAFQDDSVALDRVKTRLVRRMFPRRMPAGSKHDPITIVLERDFLAINQRKGGHARAQKLGRRRLKRIAQQAARIRWAKVKEGAA